MINGKYDFKMVKKYCMKKINYNKERECNEDVFVMKKENDHMFLKMFTFKFSDVKKKLH